MATVGNVYVCLICVPMSIYLFDLLSVTLNFLQEFLKTRFRVVKGAQTTKSRVLQVIQSENDSQARPAIAGRAVSAAFGKKLHNHGKKG